MKLLNLSEHRSCFNYQLNFASGFTRYKLAAQECGQVDNDSCFCILFLLKGELLVDIGQEHHISLLRNRMLLIPQREENRIKSVVPAECLLLFWNKQITACDKMYFDSISRDKLGERDNCILLIRKPLLHVLRQLPIFASRKIFLFVSASIQARLKSIFLQNTARLHLRLWLNQRFITLIFLKNSILTIS